MNSHFYHDWQPSHVEQLKSMWGNVSAAIIAGQILGDKKKRNAIIGKAYRLGLIRLKTGIRVGRPRSMPKPRPKRSEMLPELTLLDMRLITIVELTKSTCHWPIGDPSEIESFRYCGLFKQPDNGPYCPHHFQKSLSRNERVFACSP